MSNSNPSAQTVSAKQDSKAPSFMVPIFKLPIALYQLRVGWLLGNRFAQITHIGRHTGKMRKTILAVLRFDPHTKEILAISAWKGSDWYYNIQATRALQVQSGRVYYIPQQRTLSSDEIAKALVEYRKQHQLFSRIICRIPGWKWDSTYDEFLVLARTLHGVVFKPLSQ